jgi:hypothetical protein
MFLRPASPFKRLVAIVIGLIWTAVGGAWTYFNLKARPDPSDGERAGDRIAVLILLGGVGLVCSGLRRSRPAHIEAETPDLHEGFAEHRWRD